MDHQRLKDLATIILQEAKSLLMTDDPSVTTLTDPIRDSGRARAQTFTDDSAGNSDYTLWVRLLHLHCAARSFVDQRPGALLGLQQEITELERLTSPDDSREVGDDRGTVSATLHVD